MKDSMKPDMPATPILFPFDPKLFWETMRLIVREEMTEARPTPHPRCPVKRPGWSINRCTRFQRSARYSR